MASQARRGPPDAEGEGSDPKDAGSAERAEQRREQILKAAYRVFATKGYADATIADIARHLRLGHGTIYRYYENKHDIFEAVVTQGLERVARAIASEDPHRASTVDEYRAQVERIGRVLIDLLDRDPAVARILFYEAMGVSAELDEMMQRAWEAAGQVTAVYLRNGKDKGFLRPDLDTETTALAINALMFEAGRRLVRARDSGQARERWLKTIVELIFDGIPAK